MQQISRWQVQWTPLSNTEVFVVAPLLVPRLGKPSEVRAVVKVLFEADGSLRLHSVALAEDDAVAALREELNPSVTRCPGTSRRLDRKVLSSEPQF